MFLAQEYDAVADGVPYLSPRRTRLISPDLRSRIVGYLSTAPLAAPGFRTDGVWVWPEALAEHARTQGARPQAQLFEHMRERWFLLPDSVSAESLAEAARFAEGPPTPDPPPQSTGDVFLIGREPAAERGILRWQYDVEGGGRRERAYIADGWSRAGETIEEVSRTDGRPRTFDRISEYEASRINDDRCRDHHRQAILDARETEPGEGGMRLARVFDGESPDGGPWFSPARLRVPEPERRARLAEYLAGGRLTVRATGHMVDPLAPGSGPVVPLSFRTDGTWIWQEALAYYIRHRAVAPELELLCHIEDRGYRMPADVPADVLASAAATVQAGPRAAPSGQPMTYYRSDIGALFRARGGEPYMVDLFGPDLRWTPSDRIWHSRYGFGDEVFTVISETDAVAYIEKRLARGDALSPAR
jgi:hypothetical protein